MTTKKHKVLFFDFVTHYGGAQRSTVYLMQQLSRSFDVHVLDPYGVCQDYLAAMEHCHVPATVMPCQLASFLYRWFQFDSENSFTVQAVAGLDAIEFGVEKTGRSHSS